LWVIRTDVESKVAHEPRQKQRFREAVNKREGIYSDRPRRIGDRLILFSRNCVKSKASPDCSYIRWEKLAGWVEQGAPDGDPSFRADSRVSSHAPAQKPPDLERVDAVLDTGSDYTPGLGASAYRCS